MSQEIAWIMAGTMIWTVVVSMGVYWKSSSPWRLLIPLIMIGTVAVFLGVWLFAWQRRKSRGDQSDADPSDPPKHK